MYGKKIWKKSIQFMSLPKKIFSIYFEHKRNSTVHNAIKMPEHFYISTFVKKSKEVSFRTFIALTKWETNLRWLLLPLTSNSRNYYWDNLLVILFTLTHPSKRIKTDERKVRSRREICLKLTINTSKKKS